MELLLLSSAVRSNKMFSYVNCKFCIFTRIVNCSRCARTFRSCNYTMENNLSKQENTHSKGRDSTQSDGIVLEKKDGNILMDSAVLYVDRTVTPFKTDIGRETVLQNQKENFQRTSVPFSSTLLESSFNTSQCQKRKTHLSGDSFQKCARTEQEENFEEENVNSNENLQKDHDKYVEKRRWELTNLGFRQQHRPHHGFEFFIMSYNILAQNLLEDNIYLYKESDEHTLDWKNRSKKLLLEIKELKAEILCLQEVHHKHYYEFLEPELKQLGYKGVYLKRTGDKLDGCATLYRTDKFTLVESVPVPYYKSDCNLLDRDNVGLVLKLRPHKRHCSEEDHICVANTHLLFNPRRGDIKLAQTMCLLAELNRVAKTQRNSLCQVIVCGDFNATPFSDLYKFLVQGYLRYEGLLTRTISGQKEGSYGRDKYLEKNFFPQRYNISDQCEYINPVDKQHLEAYRERLGHHISPFISQSSGCLWHRLNLVSTYRHTIERLGHREREITTQHSGDNCTVDYIFYNVVERDVHTRRSRHRTSNIVEGKLRLLGRWGLKSSREISELGNLPNYYHPSDHLPLLVKMILV